MSARTPGPWVVRESPRDDIHIGPVLDGANGDRIACILYAGDSLNTNANASHIAQACNAHDYLVAALKLIVDSEPCDTGSVVCDFETLQGVARAALARVAP